MHRKYALTRREWVGAAAAGLAGATLLDSVPAVASAASFIAQRPAGFVPLAIPGRVVKVSAKGAFSQTMQRNELWPKPDVARRLLEKAMTELTGAPNLAAAMGKFIHQDDVVAIKPNGIAGKDNYAMAVNYELILPVVEAVLKVGVPPEKITVYEQTTAFLQGCRVNVREWKLPPGVKTDAHGGIKVTMPKTRIFKNIETAYCSTFTDATAVIDMTMIKDHSITGYTGTMKNITHGNINNPHEHHAHQASPTIAVLYNHPVVTSRVRLHIVDAFKFMADKGPLYRGPQYLLPHGSVYVSTDPVAMDTIGLKLVEDERKKQGLKTLSQARREPRYIRTASELGLGVHDLNQIRLRSLEI
jgi:uncharacterized protein (DUF362 family)